ncbi:alpha/beta hydrolase [Hyphobacterium sp.]|uniref:alpha/beta hydrolase n=1 Tax=Hyphobacterium sp. TaxID=2004662 RepID=UPI003BAC0C26
MFLGTTSKLSAAILLVSIGLFGFVDRAYGQIEITPNITYAQGSTEAGDIPLMLDIYTPDADCPSQGCRLIIGIHGGGFVGGARDSTQFVDLIREAVNEGYSVAMISYRLAGDRPVLAADMQAFLNANMTAAELAVLNSDTALGWQLKAYFGAMEDTRSAMAFLMANAATYNLDTRGLVLWGSSAGAITSLNVAYGSDELGWTLAAPVTGVIDYYGSMSRLFTLAGSSVPMMVIHGDADPTVAYQEALDLVAEEATANNGVWFYPLSGVGHGFGAVQPLTRTVQGTTIASHNIAFLDTVFAGGAFASGCVSDMPELCSAANFSAATIAASILPGARAVTVGNPATAFAAITNIGESAAENCRLELLNSVDAAFSYQTTSPANALTGTVDTPVNIAAGQTQNFLFSLTPNSVFSGTTAIIDFVCDGSVRATYRPGLTDFVLSSDADAPDILAIGSTLSADGVARVGSPTGFVPFAVSAINIGAGDATPDLDAPAAGNNQATITVTPEDGGLALPIAYDICEANASSVCVGPRGPSVTAQIGDQPSFFVVRALAQNAGIPLFPDIVRSNVVFRDGSNVVRGRTSVAVTVEGRVVDTNLDSMPAGIWAMDIGGAALEHGEIFQGTLVIDPGGGHSALSDGERFGQNHTQYGFFERTLTTNNSDTPQPSFSGSVLEIVGGNGPAASRDIGGRWMPENFIRGNVTPTAAGPGGVDAPSLLADQPRRIRAVYSLLSRRTVTQAGIAGVYDLVDEENGQPRELGTVTISAQGIMSGNVSDGTNACQLNGTMILPQAGLNVFTVGINLTGGCQFAGSYFGHSAQLDDPDGAYTNGLAMIFGGTNAMVSVVLIPDAQFP